MVTMGCYWWWWWWYGQTIANYGDTNADLGWDIQTFTVWSAEQETILPSSLEKLQQYTTSVCPVIDSSSLPEWLSHTLNKTEDDLITHLVKHVAIFFLLILSVFNSIYNIFLLPVLFQTIEMTISTGTTSCSYGFAAKFSSTIFILR